MTADELQELLRKLGHAREDAERGVQAFKDGQRHEAYDYLSDVTDVLWDAEREVERAWLKAIREECG